MADDGHFTLVPGGVTAAAGFLAGAVHCGIKPGNLKKPDLAMVCAEGPSVGAATFTTNKIKAAPVKVSMAHLRTANLRAVILNSGNANACTGPEGIDCAKRMANSAARALKLRERQVLVCSTGRIGVPLPIEVIEEGMTRLGAALRRDGGKTAAKAIMTSDTFPKEFAVRGTLTDGRTFVIGGMAKGAGMIDPNMATMLCVLTTDAPLDKRDLQRALGIAVEQSFNRITVDGDMSTNDTVIALANGRAGGSPLTDGADFELFQNALNHVTRNLARMIVEDGEGVSRFVEVRVSGAATFQDARKAAEAVANSTLVKCAWHGGDPNWGRILDALGYSTAALREELIDVYYNGLIAVKAGVASRTPRAKLEEVVREKKFTVHIHLHLGSAEYIVYTTDLTPDYVRLNKGE
jgi:glutamate N-acetyltransferase/amino-acid N-acetyltransferase